MEGMNKLRESMAELSDFADGLRTELIQKNGALVAYRLEWAPAHAHLIIKQAHILIDDYNRQINDLEVMARINTDVMVRTMAEKQAENFRATGMKEISDNLLRMLDLQDKYDVFPFENTEQVLLEFEKGLFEPIDNLLTCLEDISGEKILEFLDICFENSDGEFSFSEDSLIYLNGLNVIKKSLDNAINAFDIYKNHKDDYKDLLWQFCLEYYDNVIPGNVKRKHSRVFLDEPKAALKSSEESYIKNWAGGIAAGVVAVVTALILNGMGKDAESLFLGAIFSGGVGFIIGRIIGAVIAAKKENKIIDNWNAVKAKNDQEEKRWRAEVEKEFNGRLHDVAYLNAVVNDLLGKLYVAHNQLTNYVQEKFSFMPQKYILDDLAVATFYGYVRDKRVDTLQQAVNYMFQNKSWLNLEKNSWQIKGKS